MYYSNGEKQVNGMNDEMGFSMRYRWVAEMEEQDGWLGMSGEERESSSRVARGSVLRLSTFEKGG